MAQVAFLKIFFSVKEKVIPTRRKMIGDLARDMFKKLKGNTYFEGGLTHREIINFIDEINGHLEDDMIKTKERLQSELEELKELKHGII